MKPDKMAVVGPSSTSRVKYLCISIANNETDSEGCSVGSQRSLMPGTTKLPGGITILRLLGAREEQEQL